MFCAIYLMSKLKEYVMREAPARRSGPQLEQQQVQRTEQHRGCCSCKTAAAQWDGDCQVSPRSPAPCRLQVQAPRSACFDGCLPSLAVWAFPCSSTILPSLPQLSRLLFSAACPNPLRGPILIQMANPFWRPRIQTVSGKSESSVDLSDC